MRKHTPRGTHLNSPLCNCDRSMWYSRFKRRNQEFQVFSYHHSGQGAQESRARASRHRARRRGVKQRKAVRACCQRGNMVADTGHTEYWMLVNCRIRIRSPVSGKLFGHNSTIISDPSQLYKDPRLQYATICCVVAAFLFELSFTMLTWCGCSGYVAMVMLNGFEATAIKDNIATAEE